MIDARRAAREIDQFLQQLFRIIRFILGMP
jgi:hypothetical protein